MAQNYYDLMVIGGGTSGYMVASGAAKLGFKVALVEKSAVGGLSLTTGCVASKALINIANTAYKVNNAKNIGLDARLGHIDLRAINAHIASINDKLKQHTTELDLIRAGVRLIYGIAKFANENVLTIDGQKFTARYYVLATGSRPLIPNIRNINQINYLTHETIFDLVSFPTKLIVVGSGFHALEFAQAFSRLGARVYVVERNEHILPTIDPQIAWQIRTSLEQEGVVFCTGTQIQDCYVQKNKKFLSCMDAHGQSFTLFADEILLDVGRRANVDGLGLANARVKHNHNGILVDRKLRTSRKNIFAIGDVVINGKRDNSIAQYDANILLSNLCCKQNVKTNYTGFPQAMHTSPAFAQVGITEQLAMQIYKHDLKKLKITQFDFKDLDAANIIGHTNGFIKLILYKGQVVGVSIVGDNALELIAEWNLAIKTKAKLKDIANTSRAYPSLSMINKRVASATIYRNIFSSKKTTWPYWLQKILA
jgi:pyruvate/2-oxoglutarate dehydrogenase complex dihydrolipoamide dehydrogenase (E3) component